jgi:UDP-glucose 4-epimerase
MAVAEDRGNYYRVPPDNRDLNYAVYVDEGLKEMSEAQDFNSHNTQRLTQTEMTAILRKLPYMQSVLRGEDGEK